MGDGSVAWLVAAIGLVAALAGLVTVQEAKNSFERYIGYFGIAAGLTATAIAIGMAL